MNIDPNVAYWGDRCCRAEAKVAELREALKDLLEADEEYVRINNLHNSDGTPATNYAMRRARAVLDATETQ